MDKAGHRALQIRKPGFTLVLLLTRPSFVEVRWEGLQRLPVL